MQQQKTSHWLIAFRVIFTAALLACILFIFRNSMQTGGVSSSRTPAVTTLGHGLLGKFGLRPLAQHIITAETPNNPRALPAEELAAAVAKVNPSVEAAGSIAQAVEKALTLAGKEDAIIIFGSLSFLGEAADALN